MRFVDLTIPFAATMPIIPGDPAAKLTPLANIADHGFTDHLLETPMHVGTHMDAPLHMIEDGQKMDQIPADHFIGRGIVVDARNRPSLDEDLLQNVSLKAGDVLLFLTNHSQKFGDDDYYETYPALTPGLAQKIVDKGVKIVGLDMPSPDYDPYPVHKILLGNHVLIIENLINLEALLGVSHFEIMALPMKLQSDGAPARVIARIIEE